MSPNDPIYDDSTCAYCGLPLVEDPNSDSWQFNGYCNAECAGFDLINQAKWTDDDLHASQRQQMMAAFGNLARFTRKATGLDRDLAFTQITGELPISTQPKETK